MDFSQDIVNRLVERGYKAHQYDLARNYQHWLKTSELPIAFFMSATKKTFQEECDRRGVIYSAKDPKYKLQDRLLSNESVYFRLLCNSENTSTLLIAKNNSLLQDVLDQYNSFKCNIGTKYTSVMMGSQPIILTTSVGAVSAIWKQNHSVSDMHIIVLYFL